MSVIKTILIIIFFIPILTFGQKGIYPKDTIYIKYENKLGNKKILNWKHNNKDGIYFSIKDISEKYISLFYEQNRKTDTLSLKHLKGYTFLNNLKEIRKKHNNWIDRKFKNSKYKPYNGYFNSSFHTYLIEAISDDKFIVYPVIWRNEGVID